MERLRSHGDFVAVLRFRHTVSGADIVVHYRFHDAADGMNPPVDGVRRRRIGFAVSKSVGNAVRRNAVKRRLRVLARRYEDSLPDVCDVVLRAKPSAAHAQFRSLDRQVARLFAEVGRGGAHSGRKGRSS